MSIIIIGAGEVGYPLARRLSQEKQDVVIIDRDPEKIRRVQNTLDVQAIQGSGGSVGVLKEAGISEASMVIAVTNSDEVNMISCLVAGVQDNVPTKIARVRDPEYSALFPLFNKEQLDIDLVINPDHEVVDLIFKLMEVPGAVDVADFADGKVRMVGLPLLSDSPMVGKTLAEISAMYPKSGILIVAVQKGDRVFIPKGPHVIRANDLLFMVMARDKMREALESSGHRRPPIKRVMILGGGLIGRIIEYAGVDALHISCVIDATYNPGIPSVFSEKTIPAFLRGFPYDSCIPCASNIKQGVKIPVIGVGMVRDAEFARRVIKRKLCDLSE